MTLSAELEKVAVSNLTIKDGAGCSGVGGVITNYNILITKYINIMLDC